MASSGWALLLTLTFGFFAGAAETESKLIDRAKVKSFTLEDQLKELNSFQTDCLAVLKPADKYLDLAETFKTKKSDSFFLRMTGASEASVKISFATDFITYLDSKGTELNYNFHLKKIPIRVDENGKFAFSLVLRKGQVFIPMVFETAFKQNYELALKISDTGKILESVLKPILSEDTRMRLCQRSRLQLGFGFNLLLYEQSVKSLGASLSSSSLQSAAMTLYAVWAKSPTADHVVSYESLPGSIRGSKQFQGILDLPWQSIGYHYQQRSLAWNTFWRTAFVQPFLSYGLQMNSLPLTKILNADEAQVESINFYNASFGGGVNVMGEDDWMVEASAHLQYPLYSSLNTQYKMILNSSMGFYSSFNRKYYYGLVWSGQVQQFSYQRGDTALDTEGSANLMSSVLALSLGRFF